MLCIDFYLMFNTNLTYRILVLTYFKRGSSVVGALPSKYNYDFE